MKKKKKKLGSITAAAVGQMCCVTISLQCSIAVGIHVILDGRIPRFR